MSPAGVLDWSRFKAGAVAPAEAFEAFSAQLFERWVRRTMSSPVRAYVLNGAGGDGGVEAFAVLADGRVAGLQAKWFPGSFGNSQVKQVRKSLGSALNRHPALGIYVVALPWNLTSATHPKKGGLERWREFDQEVENNHAGLDLFLWNEARLLEELAVPENQELRAAWFEGELSTKDLTDAWQRAKARLGARYIPDLHAVGTIEAVLDRDLFYAQAQSCSQECLAAAKGQLERAARTLADIFPHLESAAQSCRAATDAIQSWADQASRLIKEASSGPFGELACAPGRTEIGLALEAVDRVEEERHGPHFCHDARKALDLALNAVDTCEPEEANWRETKGPLRAFVGQAGCGKTHAMANAVARHIDLGLPAVFLAARDIDPRRGLQGMLASVLDHPQWPLRRLLDGLEALAILAQCALTGAETPTTWARTLLVIDGLDESVDSEGWRGLLEELTVELERRPRIRGTVALRPTANGENLPKTALVTALEEDAGSDLPGMFRSYCHSFEIETSAVPWLGWAMPSPLAIREFAEVYQRSFLRQEDGLDRSLHRLFGRRLGALEEDLLRRAPRHLRWSPQIQAAVHVLDALNRAIGDPQGWTEDGPILRALGVVDPEFTAERIRHVLAALAERGLVDRWWPHGERLRRPPVRYRLATRHLSDYLAARSSADEALAGLAAGGRTTFPEGLRHRQDALTLFCAMLSEEGYYPIDDIWTTRVPGLESAQTAALALIPPAQAERKRDWVKDRLLLSTGANRDTIRNLIAPVARIPSAGSTRR